MTESIFSNSHIHSPYSYSPFKTIEEIIDLSVKEKVKILGINDFCTTKGHAPFLKKAIENKIYPLLNVEYLAFDQQLYEQGIRINDFSNAGRMYLVGKGLKNNLSDGCLLKFSKLRKKQVEVAKQMIAKVNDFFYSSGQKTKITYEDIEIKIAKDFIGERHIAKAIKENFNISMSESEIRSKFLKKNGIAYVKESIDTFLTVSDCIDIIKNAGGLVCYPILFDNKNGDITEYEKDLNILALNLEKLDIKHVDIFPDRNKTENTFRLADFFNKRGFYVLFGTEHNTEEMKSLKIHMENGQDLNKELIDLSYKGCCSIASHQNNENIDNIKFGHEIIKSFI